METDSPSALRQWSACQQRPAEAFLYVAKEHFPEPIPLVFTDAPPPKRQALISIGPHTDAVLDLFKLGDDLLPSLHTLTTNV
jgi:hypothetical protein